MEFIPGATLRHTMAEEGFYPEENLLKNWLEGYFFPLQNGVEAICQSAFKFDPPSASKNDPPKVNFFSQATSSGTLNELFFILQLSLPVSMISQ